MKTWIVFLLPLWSWAQVSFEVQPREMGENEIIEWTIRIENPQRDMSLSFPGGVKSGEFHLLNNNARSTSSMSIRNSQVSQVRTLVYDFRPKKQGDLIFPEQIVTYGGQEFRSPATKIEVGPLRESLSRSSSSRRDPFDKMFTDPFGDVLGRRGQAGTPRTQSEVFVRAELPKDTFYLGEIIPFRVKLYRRGMRIESMGSKMDLPTFEGFWTEELERRPPPTVRDRVDGKVFDVNVVHERNLFANKAGTIVIEPTKFNLNVSAGGFFSKWQRIERQTEPLELKILELPLEDVPEEFGGAVGRFQLHVRRKLLQSRRVRFPAPDAAICHRSSSKSQETVLKKRHRLPSEIASS